MKWSDVDWTQAACRGIGDVMVQYDLITFQEIDPPEHIRQVCTDCPIKSDCFQYALDNYEHGWWGGTSFRNRDRIRRRNRATQDTAKKNI